MELDKIYVKGKQGKKSMMLGGFWGPFKKDPSYLSEYDKDKVPSCNFLQCCYFDKLKKVGINVLYATGCYEGEDGFEEIFNFCKEYDIGCFALNHELYAFSASTDLNSVDEKKVKDIIQNLLKRENCLGVYLQDEPVPTQHLSIGKISEIFYKNYPEGKLIANTIAGFLGERPGFNTNLYQEMTSYVENTNPRSLCFDLYFWDEGKSEFWVCFKVLSVMREISSKYNIPLIGMMQCGGKWMEETYKKAESPLPNKGQFLFNFNLLLAYGVKGIMYFPLIQPLEFSSRFVNKGDKRNFDISGLFGADGRENIWYEYALIANRQLRACEDILIYSEFKGIITSGDKPNVYLSNQKEYIPFGSFKEVKKIIGNVVCGCFSEEGKTVLYIVSFDTEKESDLEIELNRDLNITLIQGGEIKEIKSERIGCKLQAGEGVLVRIND